MTRVGLIFVMRPQLSSAAATPRHAQPGHRLDDAGPCSIRRASEVIGAGRQFSPPPGATSTAMAVMA
jgi:hypothetical protein